MMWKVLWSSWFWGILLDLEVMMNFHYLKKPVLRLAGGGCLKIVKPTVGRAFWWFCTLIEGLELFFVTIYIVSPSMKELIKPVSAFVVVLVILEALFVALIISVHDERRQVLRLQKEREKILAESGGSNGDNYLWCSRGCTDICFMRNAATMMCGDRTIWSVVNEEEVLG